MTGIYFMTFTGWSSKMSLFFFGNKFYKNKETFKIFSPQILEVYRILLVETTLESIMFHYTFSVINTMFVPCTALLYDSALVTRTLKLSATLLSISCGIHLISLLMMFSLACGLISKTQVPPQKIVSRVEIFGIGWPGVIGLTRNESVLMGSYACGIPMFCLRNKAPPHFSNRTIQHLKHNFPWNRPISPQTDNPWLSYSQDLNPPDCFLRGYLKYRVCENNPQTREDIIRKEIRWIPQ